MALLQTWYNLTAHLQTLEVNRMSKGSNYYGGFFWVALVSFIVPLFVGYKAFENLKPTTKPTPQVDASGVDHKIWDYLLKSYVASGLVDYEGMKKDYLFRDYVRQIGECNPDALETEDEKLALACNAYNALVINSVIAHKIHDNVMLHDFDGNDFFESVEHIYAGDTISLNHLEKKMIIPTYGEPRVHVGLVCAARSCPAIRPEAYTGARVRDQLQDQSVQFANNPAYVMFDPATNELKLSTLMAWYPKDFVERYPNGGHLQWINESTTEQAIKDATGKAIADLAKVEEEREIKISYYEYDWTLNSQADPTADPSKSKKSGGGFGSGSSPDE